MDNKDIRRIAAFIHDRADRFGTLMMDKNGSKDSHERAGTTVNQLAALLRRELG